jgi:hypothetical protein
MKSKEPAPLVQTFGLTAKQKKKVDKWCKEHPCSEVAVRARHRVFTYQFTPNGIGVSAGVLCSGCKGTVDVSDYETW